MTTYTPADLLRLWKLEQLPLEMATGHLIQNLVKLHDEYETHRLVVSNLRADVDRLLAHIRLPPNAKAKSSKPDETPDPEQPS